VISRTSVRFRAALRDLPPTVRKQARRAFRTFLTDPSHPSLRFKPVHTRGDIWSARVTAQHRALCVRDGDVVVRSWIGTHADYDDLLRRL
jgi:hypothetical protein